MQTGTLLPLRLHEASRQMRHPLVHVGCRVWCTCGRTLGHPPSSWAALMVTDWGTARLLSGSLVVRFCDLAFPEDALLARLGGGDAGAGCCLFTGSGRDVSGVAAQ
jgi:hypothetical protein